MNLCSLLSNCADFIQYYYSTYAEYSYIEPPCYKESGKHKYSFNLIQASTKKVHLVKESESHKDHVSKLGIAVIQL